MGTEYVSRAHIECIYIHAFPKKLDNLAMPVVLAFLRFSIPREALTGFRFLSDAVSFPCAALDLEEAAPVVTDSRILESRCFWSLEKLKRKKVSMAALNIWQVYPLVGAQQ